MLKKLFSFFAVALVMLGASAETVTLWESETSAGKLVDWGQPAYSLSADQAKATIKPGDVVVVTVASVTEGGWPQVTIGNQSGGYPPIVNVGVGGKQYPYAAEMGVFFPTTEKIYKSGFSVGGNGAYVSKVELRKCEATLNANTIWYGPKQLAYGTALEINKSVFEEVKVGDKIQIFYDKTPAEHTLQLIFGGWGGANLPTYAAWQWSNFFTEDVDAGMYEIEMIKALENFTMEVDGADKTYNLFELLQNGGLIMQGPCLVNEVRFIPAPTEADPNAIWTGEKAMNWGDGVTLSKDFFQNVCPGDTLIVKCDNQSYQTLFGGWSGLNVACYDAGNYDFVTAVGGRATFILPESFKNYTIGDNQVNVFDMIKANGIVIHGTTTITEVIYRPNQTPPAPEEHFYITGDFGDPAWNPQGAAELVKGDDGIYAYTAAQASSIKISKKQGAWNVFNSALLYPTNYDGASIAAGEWMAYEVCDAMDWDYEGYTDNIIMPWKGDWTVSINAAEGKMQFTTTTPEPQPMTVYYNNVVTNWDEVYVYMWNTNNDNNGAWPGHKMTKGEGTIWSYTFTGFEPAHLIFNNGDNGQQTGDLDFEAGKTYGDTNVELYLRGAMNEWGTDAKFETTDHVIYTMTGVNIEAGQEFKIANSTWNISYGYNEPIALGVEYTLATDGGNMTLAETMANGSINFDFSTGKATFTQGAPEPDDPYVYKVGQEVVVDHKYYEVVDNNIVSNYNFADGTYTGWVRNDDGKAVDPNCWEILGNGLNGANYLHNTGKVNGGSGSESNIRHAWDLEPGMTYMASYWTKGSNSNVRFWNSAEAGVKTPDNNLALLVGTDSEDWIQNSVIFQATEEAHKALLNCAWCGKNFGVTYISIVPVAEKEVDLTTIVPDTYYNLKIQDTEEDLYLSAGWQDDKRQVLTLPLDQGGYENVFKFVPVADKEGVYNIIGLDGKAIWASGGWDCFWNGEPTEANLASADYQFTVVPEVGYILIKTKNQYIGSDGITNWSKLWTNKSGDKVVKFFPIKYEVPAPPTHTVTDVLNYDNTTIANSGSSYVNIENVTVSSDAVYFLHAANGNGNKSIQLRATSPAGIVSTVSGGKLKKVTVTFNTSSANGRVVDVYAKNEAYTEPKDLYSAATQGTKVASLTYATGTTTYSYEFEDEYQYIGMRSNNGALYLDEIQIEWEADGPGKVVAPVFTPAAGMVKAGTEVTLATQTEGAEIYYTTDESVPTAESTKYTAPIAINDYTIIKAVAIANGAASDVVTAEYMIMPEIEDLSPIMDFPDKTDFIVNCELTVVYVNGSNVYVYDGTNYGLIYKKDLGLVAGDVIAAGWDAQLSVYSGLYEMVPQTELVKSAAQPKVANPMPVDAEDAETVLAPYNMNRYFTLQGVVFDAATPASVYNFTGKMGETEVTFRNNFAIASVEAGTYNVTGFLGVYNTGVQFYPISYEVPVTVCDNIAAMANLTEEQAQNVKLILTDAKVTFFAQGLGAYFIEDATGAMQLSALDENYEPAAIEGVAQGKAITGTMTGMYMEGQFMCFASDVDITASVDADVTYGAEMTIAEAKSVANVNKLVTFTASDGLTITRDEDALIIAQGDDMMLVMDPFYSFPEDYEFPEAAQKVTGIMMNMGMAFLAPRDPADIVPAEEEDPNVLWKSNVEAEQSTADWRRVFTMTAEEAQEKIAVGDYLLVTVSYVDPSASWPQVAILPIQGWPPYINEGVSKDANCPFVVRFPIAGPTAKQMWENGFGVSGGEVRISKIALEKATEELDPNTVWFGGKQCGWGDGISLSKDIFANAKAGDKVVINYAPGEATLQLMPGGWDGPNFPIYAGLPFFVRDEANSQMIFTLQDNFDALDYEDNTYDVFELLKSAGLMMHGPCFVNSILYIPYVEPAPEYTVYFDNSASQWETVYAYAWAGEVNNTWPGQEMTKGENDLWSITFTDFEPENIIFNNGNGKQTEDLAFEAGKTYVGEAPASPKELYFRGSINDWGTSMKFETADEVSYTLTVSDAIPANAEFKIANADWSVSYTYEAAAIEPNVEYTFIDGNGGPGNAKIAVEIPAGATVTFNVETLVFKIEAEIDGINAIDAEEGVEYYNLQGVRLAKPTVGKPCIRVANGVATKVIIK